MAMSQFEQEQFQMLNTMTGLSIVSYNTQHKLGFTLLKQFPPCFNYFREPHLRLRVFHGKVTLTSSRNPVLTQIKSACRRILVNTLAFLLSMIQIHIIFVTWILHLGKMELTEIDKLCNAGATLQVAKS